MMITGCDSWTSLMPGSIATTWQRRSHGWNCRSCGWRRSRAGALAGQ
jgi:hypothetical protein